MAEAYIIDGVRTPIGSHGGALSEVRPDDMAAHTIAELMRRNPDADPSQIADVVLGNANQAGEDNRNVARMAALLAGLPVTVPGETVNRLCASGLSAVASAARGVKLGEGELYIAGGVESMTRAPFVMGKSAQPFGREVQMFDTSIGWRFVNPTMKEQYGVDSMPETAENVATDFGIEREAQDRMALASQQKAVAAQQSGFFDAEITPVAVAQKKGESLQVTKDEHPRETS
ncbi:MAG: 3-oxoadipyl-CoA thiolase, partial [Gemmatimonadaceae bacterium]|nr:3-oxoadipyl-CoA thiolase [Gemmatimonadaceae bacterium]